MHRLRRLLRGSRGGWGFAAGSVPSRHLLPLRYAGQFVFVLHP